MFILVRLVFFLMMMLAVAAAGAVAFVKTTGLTSQPDPWPLETRLARALRALAVPEDIKTMKNPVTVSPEAIAAGRRHFAGYCSPCHGNDGGGQGTSYGRGFFPKAPDMRLAATQSLTDGELFYVIENGVRFTGMPAFGTGTADPKGETLVWQLVHFIRRLPSIDAEELEEMKSLNP
jgi:mono/diheme cytochrome c family protein